MYNGQCIMYNSSFNAEALKRRESGDKERSIVNYELCIMNCAL